MLPALLHDHWQRINSQLIDSSEYHGFEWTEIWQKLSPEQQAQVRRVLTVSQYVVDSIPRETVWFRSALLENHFLQPVTYSLLESWFNELTDFALTEDRSEEHTSELQSRPHLVCRLLLEKKKIKIKTYLMDVHFDSSMFFYAKFCFYSCLDCLLTYTEFEALDLTSGTFDAASQ